MAAKVVDASVIAAFAFGEPESASATAMMRGHELHAPAILPFEIANVAATKVRRSPEKREAMLDGLRVALAMDITLAEPDYVDTAVCAMDSGIAAHDAAYLVLARSLEADLLTFDRAMLDVHKRTQPKGERESRQ